MIALPRRCSRVVSQSIEAHRIASLAAREARFSALAIPVESIAETLRERHPVRGHCHHGARRHVAP